MYQDKPEWKAQLLEAARVAMLSREAEIRRVTAESMWLPPDPPIKNTDVNAPCK